VRCIRPNRYWLSISTRGNVLSHVHFQPKYDIQAVRGLRNANKSQTLRKTTGPLNKQAPAVMVGISTATATGCARYV